MEKTVETYDVIVVGGGAAGMMAAGTAAARGKKVLLLEKNKKLGEKLRISGGGRCNITNAETDEKVLLSHFGEAEQFLYSAFSQFGLKETVSFFETRGLPLKVEAHKRAFPVSESAEDVCETLRAYMARGKVQLRTGVGVTDVLAKRGRIQKVVAGHEEFMTSACILATGGVSHPETGSTGDGFAFLERLGHTVVPPTPTIVPLRTKEAWARALSGTSLQGVKITFFVNGTKKFSIKGAMHQGPCRGAVLFTHFGISGPLILNSAGKVADLLHEGVVTASIDTRPDKDLGILDKEITAVFDRNKNKLLKNIWKEIAPSGTAEALATLLPDVDFGKKVHSITKEERRRIAELLKALPLTIKGLMGFERAVVADGGVPLAEVDMRTMHSKLYKNLFITGDLLHITRPSGGYSLQLCWTSGYVAGKHVGS